MALIEEEGIKLPCKMDSFQRNEYLLSEIPFLT